MYALKRFFAIVGASLIALVALACVRGTNISKFSALQGERTFYLHSASSQGLRTASLQLKDIPFVRGESVRLTTAEKERFGKTASEIALSIAQAYGASIVIEETVCGAVSYYAYTPAWGECVWVGGQPVNLHIAVSETACAVGSPIIFDGF